ncbi:nuclear transport factor 2 family protein [Salipiger mucosus]|uniref:Putative inner membrane protein n=1 Tax=Salipiger mucosus DSM 16094 TaxID=1123237 RepID=S9QZW4_9RHOB|nr:nuclear transport factor 2 family protein [Salipiger mucosus]EPX85117.1 Putative inner membrane protein [Salipiger mucosus DSM 16094]
MTPRTTALAFLGHLAEGAPDRAAALLAPDAVMTFPGGATFRDLAELAAWSAPRYARIAKRIERAEESAGAVYVSGTLEGAWPDGTPFSGIRFIDRFEVADGLILRQEVWNDMAEHRP